MIKREKRGLAPVIATVLLISLALVLVLIIFIWAKSWIGEKIEKNLGAGPEVIENFCGDIDFAAELDSGAGRIDVNNLGNVPLYGLDIRKRDSGSEESFGIAVFGSGLAAGASGSADISLSSGVNVGDELIALPVILGETEEYRKPYTCAEEFGELITVV